MAVWLSAAKRQDFQGSSEWNGAARRPTLRGSAKSPAPSGLTIPPRLWHDERMEQEIHTMTFRRPPEDISFMVERSLTSLDLAERKVTPVGSKPPALKNLRATHHRLAQLLASGMKPAEASLGTGYSLSRISILQADPAFAELLAHYSEKREEAFVDVQQRMAGVATDILEVLQERLAESPDSFSNKDLNELVKTTADRGGYSPVQKTETKNITISASDLLAIKEEVAKRQNGQIRKINQIEEAGRVKAFTRSEEPAGGETRGESTSNLLEAPEAAGSTGQRSDIREACWEDVEELGSAGGTPRDSSSGTVVQFP